MSRKTPDSTAARLRKASTNNLQARQKPAAGKTRGRSRQKSADNPAPLMLRPPPPGEGKRGERGYLAYLLRQAQAATRLAMERSLAELGVTSPQFVVLTMLRAYPGLSGAELARVAMLTPQTTGVIIRNLEREGAIRKTPHPIHGRVLQWTVTRRGAALLDKCRRHAQVIERRLAAGLSAGAERLIRRWLARIAADL
ncbi:MarR family transcriptional regulator [Bradyrhizobium sp. WSM 1791]|uniref:MarR family transcriptional regulator n=2 Tax=Bradyrhizobium australiense TaxID=2721161 RepID=A0A7Y4GRD8_9BRAD|nr:MarR family transcriptional regulator [Bradyrhizobium australiense]